MYKERRKKLKKLLKDNSILIVFSGKAPRKSEDSFHNFYSNRNFFYLTGITRENFVYVYNNLDKEEVLFIQKPNEKTEKWFGRFLKDDEAKEISKIDNIKYNEEVTNYLINSLKDNNIENVYLDIKNWDI